MVELGNDFTMARNILWELGDHHFRDGEGWGRGGSLQTGVMRESKGNSPPRVTEASDTSVSALNSCSPSPPALEFCSFLHNPDTGPKSPGDNLSVLGDSLAAEEGTQKEAIETPVLKPQRATSRTPCLCQSTFSFPALFCSHWKLWLRASQRDCLASLLEPERFLSTSEREDGELLLSTAWKTRVYSFFAPGHAIQQQLLHVRKTPQDPSVVITVICSLPPMWGWHMLCAGRWVAGPVLFHFLCRLSLPSVAREEGVCVCTYLCAHACVCVCVCVWTESVMLLLSLCAERVRIREASFSLSPTHWHGSEGGVSVLNVGLTRATLICALPFPVSCKERESKANLEPLCGVSCLKQSL